MTQLKTSPFNTIPDLDDIKNRKLNVTTDGYITTFEDLSNETVYEVFEYLDLHSSFEAFYDLNQRFQNLFIYINLTIKINISSISKSNFHRYLTHIIKPHSDRIQSLRISTLFTADMILLLSSILKNFIRMETLILNNIESKYIEQILDHLSNLPVLSSLTIIPVDNIRISNVIYPKIFRLSALKYCQMDIKTDLYTHALPIAVDAFSSIEHLIINNRIGLGEFNTLLSYVPNIRRLSINDLYITPSGWKQRSSMELRYITHVSLTLHSVRFTDLELMIEDCFRQTTHLVLDYECPYSYYIEYINADIWEQLISTSLANLHIFDCQIILSSQYSHPDQQLYDAQVRKFNLLFWTTHQWFFEHYYYHFPPWNFGIMFFSTNPYRRKKYILYKELNGDLDSNRIHTNMSSVQYLYIHDDSAMKQFMGRFPNATELTISIRFVLSRESIVTDLNRIVLLRKLTKLTINYYDYSFEHLVELLTFAPNITTLNIHAVLFHRTDSLSIQQTNIFRLVSRTNIITSLTVDQKITLKNVELVTALFPRLESLTINLRHGQLKRIIRFLLSKPHNNTRYLSTLCIAKNHSGVYEHLQLFLQSEKLLKDYILKFIDERLYLWW